MPPFKQNAKWTPSEALLIWSDALLVLDLCLGIINRVIGLHVQSDGLACECLDEDLHASAQTSASALQSNGPALATHPKLLADTI